MKEKSRCFDPRLRAVFEDVLLDDHGPILSINLQDWHLPSSQSPRNLGGRVTLAGDAAHTMAMCKCCLPVFGLWTGINC